METIIFENGRFHCMPARLRRLLKPFVKLRRMDILWEYPYEFEFNPLLETFPQRKGSGSTFKINQEEYRGTDRSKGFSGCTLNDTFQLGSASDDF